MDKVVIHSEGNVQAVCQFDCLVFKPMIGSVLKGSLVSQSEDCGLVVQVANQTIKVRPGALFQPAVWQNGSWHW